MSPGRPRCPDPIGTLGSNNFNFPWLGPPALVLLNAVKAQLGGDGGGPVEALPELSPHVLFVQGGMEFADVYVCSGAVLPVCKWV